MSITIDIDDQLLELRKLARQMAEDLKDIDLANDPDWHKAREAAWSEYGHRYTPKEDTNE